MVVESSVGEVCAADPPACVYRLEVEVHLYMYMGVGA